MSRAQRRHPERHVSGEVGVQFAACATEDDLGEACRRSHDKLIAEMGTQRRGPVQWSWWRSPDAIAVLARLRAHGDLEPVYPGLLEYLNEHFDQGYLVMATAEGVRA